MVLKLAHPALNLTLAIAWSLIYLLLLLDHSGRCKCSSRNRLRRNSTQFAAWNYVFTFLWGFGAVGRMCQAQHLGQSWTSSSGLGAVGGSTAGGTLKLLWIQQTIQILILRTRFTKRFCGKMIFSDFTFRD